MARFAKWILCLTLLLTYWSYSVDLECHIQGYQDCVVAHSDDATGCAAPSTPAPPAPPQVHCPLLGVILPEIRSACPQPAPLCLWSDPQWWPPDPDYVGEPGPPRAPPAA